MNRVKVAMFLVIGILLAGYLIVSLGSNVFTEFLWFSSLGYGSAFLTIFKAKAFSGLIFGLFAWLVISLNVYLARRFSSRPTGLHIYEGVTELEQVLYPALWADRIAFGVILLLSGLMGLVGLGQWDRFLRYFYQQPFQQSDPIFGRDLVFFVFSLPFWDFLRVWLMIVVIVAILATIFYYLHKGAILITEGSIRFRPYAKKHLYGLTAAIFLLMAWGYRLSMFKLLYADHSLIVGANYSDVHARLPAYWVLLFLALAGAAALLAGLVIRNHWLPLWVGGGMIVSIILVSWLMPLVVQRFWVKPNELTREQPYLAYNIRFTQEGYGLDQVRIIDFPVTEELQPEVVQVAQATLQNIKLLDKRPLKQTYAQLQELRPYYDFSGIDEDRYWIDGEYRQVMLAARELMVQQLALKARTWQNQHLIYTHGYGFCLSPANGVTQEGLPRLLIKDIPPLPSTPDLAVHRSEIYYGERMDNYVIVRTGTQEFDYPLGEDNRYTTYEGSGGVAIKSFLYRLAFAKRFNAPDILVSGYIGSQSRILFHRRIRDRVRRLAPFLRYDHDPYLVLASGQLYWIIDAYTVTSAFPYSERFNGLLPTPEGIAPSPEEPLIPDVERQVPRRRFVQRQPLLRNINYIRNAVKAVVNAYDGKTTLYVVDDQDPLIKTYQAIFPDLFRPFAEMPLPLKAHIRYPRDLFAVQVAMYRSYHMKDPRLFYNQEDLWAIPYQVYGDFEQQMTPYYLVMKVPQAERPEFLLLLPFTPSNKDNMIAWMAARCDLPNYGELLVFRFPKQHLIYGPRQLEARINQNTDISREFTLWGQEGSEVIRGDLLVVPIGQSFLYVEPVYLRANRGELPEMKRVIVAQGTKLVMRETFEQALQAVFAPGSMILTGLSASPGEAKLPALRQQHLQQLAQQALDQFNQAQENLKRGDWNQYGNTLKELKRTLQTLLQENQREDRKP